MEKTTKTVLIFLYFMIVYSIILNIKTQSEISKINKEFSTLKLENEQHEQRIYDLESIADGSSVYE